MPWFAAHVVMYFKRTAAPQARYTVWENVHVIEAADMASAQEEAVRRLAAGAPMPLVYTDR